MWECSHVQHFVHAPGIPVGASGPVRNLVDYIIVHQEDKAKVRNVTVIPTEVCVPKHKLLVMDMQFNTTKRWHKKLEPRVRVWKLKEEKT